MDSQPSHQASGTLVTAQATDSSPMTYTGSLRRRSSQTPVGRENSTKGTISIAVSAPICVGEACISTAAVRGRARRVTWPPKEEIRIDIHRRRYTASRSRSLGERTKRGRGRASVDGDALTWHRARRSIEQFLEQTRVSGAHQAQKIQGVVGRPAQTEAHIAQRGAQQREVPAMEHDEAVADLAVDELVVIERDAVREDLLDEAHGVIPAKEPRKPAVQCCSQFTSPAHPAQPIPRRLSAGKRPPGAPARTFPPA